MFYEQVGYDVRCEWGERGLTALLAGSDAVVIVDVLSFSTCVDIAVSRSAQVYPYRQRGESAEAYAASLGALLATRERSETGFSLSPSSLSRLPPESRIVLPSPNGSTLSLMTGEVPTLAGCLRNARAVAAAAAHFGRRISVIPAGERWPDGGMRPSLEDWLGAGAIVHALPGSRSPEAQAAEALFLHHQPALAEAVARCSSGVELIAQGFAADVALAAALNASESVPILRNLAYVRLEAPSDPPL